MSNRCQRCGRWTKFIDTCQPCLDGFIRDHKKEVENSWQDVPEPSSERPVKCEVCGRVTDVLFTNRMGIKGTLCAFCHCRAIIKRSKAKQEDAMKDVKAGQTWQGADGPFSVIAPIPNTESMVVEYRDGKMVRLLSKGYISRQCRLIRDEHGKPVEQEPEVPEKVETEVQIDPMGGVYMYLPNTDGKESNAAMPAQQGQGHNGYTCLGFRFKEQPRTIHTHPMGWSEEDVLPRIISIYRSPPYTELLIATHAVWKKLGD